MWSNLWSNWISYEWKSGITDSIYHNFARIRIYLYDSLPIKKIVTFYKMIICIKSVVNKDENKYNYSIFLGKGSYKYKFDTKCF